MFPLAWKHYAENHPFTVENATETNNSLELSPVEQKN